MDPLTALNLAVSIITLVDFTAKLISKTHQIRERGCTDDVDDLERQTTKLIVLNTGLRARQRPVVSGDGMIDSIENAIDEIVVECMKVTEELITIMDRLQHLDPRLGKNLIKAIATLLKRQKLEDLSKKLQYYRQEAGLHIVSLLNAKFDRDATENASRLDRIEENQRKIVEVITFTQTLVQTANPIHLSDNDRDILLNQPSAVRHSEGVESTIAPKPLKQHESTVSALLMLDDGTFRTISAPFEQGSKGNGKRGTIIETTTSFQGVRDSSQTNSISTTRFASLARSILSLLYIQGISTRAETIAEAHKRTFQWIYESNTVSTSGQSFLEWLETGTGCFWVNGKAGSGKSTLMKYIQEDNRTTKALEIWANENTLVVSCFYFWNSGTPIQKSQEGLLRSILITVLQQYQHLIPLVFPGLCQIYATVVNIDSRKLTLSELHRALRVLLDEKTSSLRFCLFIDGLDEYEGESGDLCDFIIELVSAPNVKAVISSRPWAAFEDQLQRYPRIRVQDLTREDIKCFTMDSLGTNMIVSLNAKNMDLINDLVTGITEKAEGVFLWVMLVVRSLQQGMRNRDRPSELKDRLDAFPHELEALYSHMINSMEPLYQQQASRIFQVVLRSNSIQVYGPMSLLQLYYAAEGTLSEAVQAPQTLLEATERATIHQEMDLRLRSRCCGILEVAEDTAEIFSGSTSLEANIRFLHQTAVDFLRMQQNQELLLSHLPLGSFDADASLLASCLREIKVLPIERAIILDSDRVMINVRHSFAYTRYLETFRSRPYTNVLDQLDHVLTERWLHSEKCKKKASYPDWEGTAGTTWSRWISTMAYQELYHPLEVPPFLALATYSGCVLYVADKTLGSAFSSRERTILLVQMIAQYFNDYDADYRLYSSVFVDKFNYVTAMGQLVAQGADPNLVNPHPYITPIRTPTKTLDLGLFFPPPELKIDTPWRYFLYNVLSLCTPHDVTEDNDIMKDPYRSITRATEILDIFQSFINTANLNETLPFYHQTHSRLGETPLSILHKLKIAVCDPAERLFQVPMQEVGLEKFLLKYNKTHEMLQERMGRSNLFYVGKKIKELASRFWLSQDAKLLLSFIVGSLVAFLLARGN